MAEGDPDTMATISQRPAVRSASPVSVCGQRLRPGSTARVYGQRRAGPSMMLVRSCNGRRWRPSSRLS